MSSLKKFSVETLGCRFNRFETAEIDYELSKSGYARASNGEKSDLVVINTCTVTDKSDSRCRSAVRKAKQKHPDAQVVVAGCYAETNPEELAAMDEVDLVLGIGAKFDLVNQLEAYANGSGIKIVEAEIPEGPLPIRPITRLAGRTSAYLNVQSGCDEVCSFCVVRIARGKSRSAEPDAVVSQIGRMVEANIKEVVLSGVNLGDYESENKTSLANLLRRILSETKIRRIRLSSINPNTIDDELIDLIATSPRICRHLHIPLQSGSDTVLERMRRPYTSGYYGELIFRLAKKIDGIGIGADVMVGFPGETDEEFEETVALIEKLPMLMLHVFNYSPRDGTEAFNEMKSFNIKPEITKRRSARLKKISKKKSEEMRSGFVGSQLQVLVESKRGSDGMLRGFTDNYLPVSFSGGDELRSEIVKIKLTADNAERMTGILAE